jgi:cell volume regulation protein A
LDTPLSIEIAKHTLLVFSIILCIGAVVAVLAGKLRVPDVVFFLLAGLLMGPSVGNVVNVKTDSALNQLILIFGSCYILFDGGASLRLKVLKEVWLTILILATVGVLITAGVTSVAAYYLLSIPLVTALLLATTIASTDPATLVPVFRQVKIKDRVAQTVMAESAFNDATGAIATFAVLGFVMGKGEFSLSASLLDLVKQAGFGLLVGGTVGYVSTYLMAHPKFGFLRDYAPVVTLIMVITAYLGADALQASGFMAVFICGIVVGNKDVFGFQMNEDAREALEHYVSTTALIMRMFIFILLGTQVDFELMNKYLAGGIAVVLVFMFIARPVTVFLCALPDRRVRWSLKELLFMSWTRETGVIPGALAGLLLGMQAPGAKIIASVTFIAILMTILLQATTTRWLARKLDLLEEYEELDE